MIITLFTQWSIGFSVISALLLWCVYLWVYEAFDKTWLSKLACTAMLGVIAALQAWHGWALATGDSLFESSGYLALLYSSPIAFFGFFSTLINVQTRLKPLHLTLALPLIIGPFLPGVIAIPLAFALGGTAALVLAWRLYPLKDHRQHFALERMMLMAIAGVAFLILLVGLVAPWLGEVFYVITYANLTGLVFAAILWLLIRYPDVLQKALEVVSTSYANSTLKSQNSEQLVKQLQALMTTQQLYKDEGLNLPKLAEALNLTPHQTSELVNTQFGISISKLIRHYRVQAAKHSLLAEPNASVLSVGLSVGFNSQSTFYTAFRAVTGQTPNQYRQQSNL